MKSNPDAEDPSLIDAKDINILPEEIAATLNARFNITDIS